MNCARKMRAHIFLFCAFVSATTLQCKCAYSNEPGSVFGVPFGTSTRVLETVYHLRFLQVVSHNYNFDLSDKAHLKEACIDTKVDLPGRRNSKQMRDSEALKSLENKIPADTRSICFMSDDDMGLVKVLWRSEAYDLETRKNRHASLANALTMKYGAPTDNTSQWIKDDIEILLDGYRKPGPQDQRRGVSVRYTSKLIANQINNIKRGYDGSKDRSAF